MRHRILKVQGSSRGAQELDFTSNEYQDRFSSLLIVRDYLLCTSCWSPSHSHCGFNFSTSLALPMSIIPEPEILPIPPESTALSHVFVLYGLGFLGLNLFMLC